MAASNEMFSRDALEAAIIKAEGNVARAAEIAGCDRTTIYKAIERYKSLRNVIDRERRQKRFFRVLTAEANLDDKLKDKHWGATEYVLSTLGKAEGYSRRQEIAGVPDQPLDITVKDSDEWQRRKQAQADAAGVVLTK